MIKQLYLLPLLLLGLFLQGYSQGSIQGKVLDENGEGAIGANIVLKGTTKGAVADLDGNFILENVPKGEQTISIIYVGYADKEETVTIQDGQTATLNVSLSTDADLLDEVVVVGYGVQRKREVVGSISKVKAEDISESTGASFETALQGKTTGVQVTQGSGVAGSGSVVRIRGIGSLTAGGDPLYVVDGIPITQDYFLGENRGNQNNNPLSFINPNDIESIEVLKDASAAAIYGSRGANGVILITTKRGKGIKGKPLFNFNTSMGISQPTNRIKLLNSEQLLAVRQEAWENDGNVGRAPLPDKLTDAGYTYEDIENTNTEWMDLVLQNGFKQDYNLSMQHGTKWLNTYLGASYTNAESFLKGNAYNRASGRANFDIRPIDRMSISINTSLTRGFTDRIDNLGGGLGLAQSSALPIYPIKNEDGSWFNPNGNPLAQEELKEHNSVELRSVNGANINYEVIKGLNVNLSGNYDFMKLNDYIWLDELLANEILDGVNYSRSENWKTINKNYSAYGTISYDYKLNDDNNFKLLVGSEYQQSTTDGAYKKYLGLPTVVFQSPKLMGNSIFLTSNSIYDIDKWKFFSTFARLNYSWKDKLFAQVTFRRDGSSKFGPNRRFGNFPAIGLGYILSEEDFLKGNKTINYLRLKASWGRTGNSDISWKRQFASYSFLDAEEINAGLVYGESPIRFPIKVANPDLQWEVVNTIDLGFELGLWDDRLTFDFTYYYQKSSKVYIGTALQASGGVNEDLVFYQNTGKIRNSGIEIGINTYNIKTKNFTWETNLNFSHNKNKVLEVGTATPDALAGGFGDTRAVVGEEVNTNFIIPFSHIDAETGRPIYKDITGIDTTGYDVSRNRQAVGSGIPDLVGGMTNTFKYKNFDLSFLFVFSYGGQIFDDAAKRHLGVVTMDDAWNYRAEILDRWREPGDDASYPQLTTTMENWGGNDNYWQNNHSLWLEDASYIRLRDLTLGYKLPSDNWKHLRSARVFIKMTNLLTFTNYSGWDPEVARERADAQERNIGGTNVTYLTPPQEKTFNIGFNIEF